MPRAVQVNNKKKFPGKGHVLGGASAPLFASHMVAPNPSSIVPPTFINSAWNTNTLKPTPMGRIVGGMVTKYGQPSNFANGLPRNGKRQTRTMLASQGVTRKSKTAVKGISEEAEHMLHKLFCCADDATKHRKRKTLKVDDMKLVMSIMDKMGA